jgi:ubiquinol-cytochrome c reductase iron-sulfur subunit
MSEDTTLSSAEPEATRRDFIYVFAGAFAAVGAAASVWPLIDQMEPSADVLAAGSPLTVDLSKVEPGQQITVMWRGRPMFIVNRTPPILDGLKSQTFLSRLRDPDSQQNQQPDYARNWSRSIKPEFLVIVGICTHLGCIPEFRPEPAAGGAWPAGYFCPCHGSRYDMAGRVFQGVPAPYNLPVPPYRFENDTTIVIGENTGTSDYSLNDVEQI